MGHSTGTATALEPQEEGEGPDEMAPWVKAQFFEPDSLTLTAETVTPES